MTDVPKYVSDYCKLKSETHDDQLVSFIFPY